MRLWLLAAILACSGCDIDFITPTPVAAPTAPGAISITNTNTNTNTASTDRSDTGPTKPTDPTGTPTNGVLPLPAYGEQVTKDYATNNPNQLLHSCQLVDGEAAWQFLDGVIAALRARSQDTKWGYLCKESACVNQARDVVAYKASESGIWIVDVIGNHCPSPSDSPAAVRWGVLPFETERPWTGVRK